MIMWALTMDALRMAAIKELVNIMMNIGIAFFLSVRLKFLKMWIEFVPDERDQTVKDWMLVVARAK